MKKIILYLGIIILIISCDATNTSNSHKIITVVNNSNKAIYIDKSSEYPNIDAYKNHPSPLYNPQ